MLWLALFFVVLYFMASRLALPRVGSILEERRSRIAGDFAAASRMKDEADAAIAAYEKALADVRSRAQAMAAEAREKLNREAEAERHTLEHILNARLAAADHAIAATKAAAMANVHAIAKDTAIAIVARLIGITPSGDAAAEAVAAIGSPVQAWPALRLATPPPQTGERGERAGREGKGRAR
jgi:F-type H+-transporting ATPase subunit b